MLILIICLILFSVFYLITSQKTKNKKFNNIIKHLQPLGVVWAFIFSLYTIYQSNLSLEKTDESLRKTDSGLALTYQSILSSDSSTNRTLNYLDSISKSSSNLKNNLDSISNKISHLPSQIDDISKSLISLNNISIEQQENLKSESQLKAILSMEFDCSLYPGTVFFRITNNGDISAEVTSISFALTGINLPLFSFNNVFYTYAKDTGSVRIFRFDFIEKRIVIGSKDNVLVPTNLEFPEVDNLEWNFPPSLVLLFHQRQLHRRRPALLSTNNR